MSRKPAETQTSMQLNPQEVALIVLIRNTKFGTIEAISVIDGRPTCVKGVSTRIDLTKDREREAIMESADPISFLQNANAPAQT